MIAFDCLRAFLGRIRLRDKGATVIILHHSRKDATTFRGSSDILAAVDWAWELSEGEGGKSEDAGERKLGRINVELKKARGLGKSFSVEFDYKTNHFVEIESGRPLAARDAELVALLASSGAVSRAKFENDATTEFKRRVSRDSIRDFIKRGLKAGTVVEVDFGTNKARIRAADLADKSQSQQKYSQEPLDFTPAVEPPPFAPQQEAA